ncbi:hypothetical protein MAPG_00156 [Magnaporthiopsis poae ATCC 64411]|uniref:Phosphoribosyltransferase domain-containing protein n=1 Tax=Magnaporthiopsis poae (strain ATCC 64411 / 73-15) TaxID=644358 RepID=A0A0C4DK93_MAGP6|nr:hypothetical protein MAPG_00156 [Magnaporthiopsis poae ATCC 64411]
MPPPYPSVPVIGLYGISGSGKTTLVEDLKDTQEFMHSGPPSTPCGPTDLSLLPDAAPFSFKEGSELIAAAVPGGLAAFKKLGADEKKEWRQSVIKGVARHARESFEPVVVVGHYMLAPDASDDDGPWPTAHPHPHPHLQSVHTPADWESYTHIIYVTVPPKTIAARRASDKARSRAPLSVEALGEWQETEKKELRRRCREHGIVFTVVGAAADGEDVGQRVYSLLEFIRQSESSMLNLLAVKSELGRHPSVSYEEEMPGVYKSHVKILAFDADRTLSAQDTGNMFWEMVEAPVGMACGEDGDRNDNNDNNNKKVPVLKQVFGGPLGYTPRAFVQALLLYEEAVGALDVGGNEKFESHCAAVASRVELRPEFISLLQRAVNDPLVVPVVITCGLRRIWELVLEREGFRCQGGEAVLDPDECTPMIWLVGAGRHCGGDQVLVHPEIKADVVRWIAGHWDAEAREVIESRAVGPNICAFGDSPVDIPMLKTARRAFVVVDEARQDRAMSKRMEKEIRMYSGTGDLDWHSIDAYKDRFGACSYLYRVELPPSKHSSEPDTATTSPEQEQAIMPWLPLVSLTDPKTLDLIFPSHTSQARSLRPLVPIHDSTASAAAKLLSTPMRDAGTSGWELQRAHRAAGKYLALQVLPEILGLERFAIPHVSRSNGDGGKATATEGYRLLHEDKTLIVSLMRGGDPMAQGVFDVFPRATYLHAHKPEDVQAKHLRGVVCVLLVDSVVNSGASMLDFVHAIRKLHWAVRIIIVAGVVQADAVELRREEKTPVPPPRQTTGGGAVLQQKEPNMRDRLAEYGNVQVVALRISDNKYKGVGGTDTGNRLFNTTHLDC